MIYSWNQRRFAATLEQSPHRISYTLYQTRCCISQDVAYLFQRFSPIGLSKAVRRILSMILIYDCILYEIDQNCAWSMFLEWKTQFFEAAESCSASDSPQRMCKSYIIPLRPHDEG